MNIGLIDVDRKNSKKPFPNLPLMKLSAYHKNEGDCVEWFREGVHYDRVYISKVFSFSPDFYGEIDSDEIIRGGSGYAIDLIDGVEKYNSERDLKLPCYIEHIYPDYSLYNIDNTAYGFLTRGCPRNCNFCHVAGMQGTHTHTVANLSEFWNGQKNIVLLDPNITASADWKNLFQQLIDSNAMVDFSQGLDIRLMTAEKAELLKKIKVKNVHFAFDRYEDRFIVERKLLEFKKITAWNRSEVSVYILTNFNTTFEEDLKRVMFVRSLNFQPYVMRYNKHDIPRGSMANALARWVNFVPLFWKYETLDDYLKNERM